MNPGPFVETIKERCRLCYTCVRECPAKAIRIIDGQAEVMSERCIACGNCVRVCSQGAKQATSSIPEVEKFLAGDEPVAACLAPSYPAEFPELELRQVVGLVRALGFKWVHEVAFGADLVAAAYRKLFEKPSGREYIATSCPAVVRYVEKYHPKLIPHMAPIVSPMIAMARVIRRLHGPKVRVVFIGPCIAKKSEGSDAELAGDVDAALTFRELREMLHERGFQAMCELSEGKKPNGSQPAPSDFDPPHGGTGALFSISRGLLHAADIPEDLLKGEVVSADGRTGFVEAIREFESGDLNARLLEVLACKGCVMGAGMTSQAPRFSRRAAVSQAARERLENFDAEAWKRELERFSDLDLSRKFAGNDQRIPEPSLEEVRTILARMGKTHPADELNCGACGYDTCVEHATAIHKGLAENEMCLPYTIEQLHSTVRQLADTQDALIQSEKLASMGQLAAGIAHEVNNPLGVVLMYAHLLLEERRNDPTIREDLTLIATQADRCKKIVSGLLQFARQNKTVRQPVDLNALVEGVFRSFVVPAKVKTRLRRDMTDPVAEVDRDQIIQVLVNLIANAIDAMPNGGELTLATGEEDDRVLLSVSDTGTGIVPENRKKIFTPFFTTKQIGKGTGLGLAVSYGIIKMHRGDVRVTSNHDPKAGPTGSTFTVELPRKDPGVELEPAEGKPQA